MIDVTNSTNITMWFRSLKFANKLNTVKAIKYEKLASATKSRTNYIPIGGFILSNLIRICDPVSVFLSQSGVREGSLISRPYLKVLQNNSLTRSVHFISHKKADYAANYLKLYNFIKNLFSSNEEYFPHRLLLPACSLSNFDWGLGVYCKLHVLHAYQPKGWKNDEEDNKSTKGTTEELPEFLEKKIKSA